MYALQPHRRPILLAIAFGLIFACAWHKARENHLDWQAQTEWQNRIAKLQVEGLAKRDQLVAELGSWRGQPGSPERMETDWNDAQPLTLAPERDLDVATWTDAIYNISFQLFFEDGVLVGHSCRWGTGDLQVAYPQPRLFSRNGAGEVVRSAVTAWAWRVWVMLLLAALFWKQHPQLEDALLISAVLAGAAWLVLPFYSLTWKGILSNDALFYAVVMILVSVTVIAVRMVQDAGKRDLRFSLKGLLLAVTFVALLLPSGPIGYVAIGVALFGLTWFAWLTCRSKRCSKTVKPDA